MSTALRRIGVLYHPSRSDSTQLADELQRLLSGAGAEAWRGAADDEPALRAVATQLDLLVTLGGDGTIMRALRTVAPAGVPLLGVNLGRLGFLTEVEPRELGRAMPGVLAGRYRVEERMMLHSTLSRSGQVLAETDAINDAVVARGAVSRTIELSVEVDGHYVMTQMADALIAATPTGSTAYNLSAGGPIVAPELRCIALTPVAAHLGIAHAIVVPAASRLRLKLLKGAGAVLTVDGQVDLALDVGDEVLHTASSCTAKFVRLGPDGYFYESVLRRLRWPDQASRP